MKKRVAINLLNFSDDKIAGAAVFAKNLLRGWLTQFEVPALVIYHSNNIDIEKLFNLPAIEGIIYKPVKVHHFWWRILYEQIIMPFRLTRFDIYYSPTPVMPFLSRIINRRLEIAVTIHDMIPFFVPNKYGKLRSIYVKLISIWGARLAHHVVTVSENSKKDIIKIARVDSSKISIVYNFIPSFQSKPKLAHEKFFLSISTIEPGKNIENTILGFKLLMRNRPDRDYKFYWIGKIGWGYTQAQLQELIADAGLEHFFFLLGYVDEKKKTDLLSRCTAVVYLSHYEGFGLPVLEGLHFNKPPVVLNNSSLPEVIGKAGILCDNGDVKEIARALSDITTNFNDYASEIPNQLRKFDVLTQIQKFLNVIGVKH